VDELNKTKDGQQRNSRGIEDVEQSALDKLLDNKDGLYDRVRARSRIWLMSANNAIKPILSSSTIQHDTPHRRTYGQDEFRRRFQRFQSQQTSESEPEYEIDPITNRKVFKNKTSENTRKPIEVPVKTFKGYRSQFQDFAPPAPQPTEPEVKTYKPLDVSDKSSSKFGKQSDSARESLKDYEGDQKYKPFFRYEPDGQKPESKTESLNEYDRKTSYEAFRWYEQPEENPPEKPCPVQEGLSEYDSKVIYGPVMYREPDGKLPEKPCPVQESLREYDNKVTYGPVMHNEPDGQPPPKRDTVAEGLRDFDNRADYGPRRILKNIFLGRGSGDTDKSFRYRSEDTREDLDLLRPSDVRAAAGINKGGKKETQEEKQAIRHKLENDFQQRQDLMEELRIENSELRNHTAHLRGRVEAELAKNTEELSLKPPQRKMTGNFVRDFPEEFETRWTSGKESASLKPENESSGQDIHEPAPKESFARNSNTPRIQTSLDRTVGGSRGKKDIGKMERLQIEIDPYSKEPQGLETSYAEEVKLENEKDPYPKKPMGLETSYSEEVAKERTLELERDPYSKDPQGLETSYATEKAQQRALEIERDPYSKVPQGLETSYVEEVKLQNEKDPYSKKPMGLETSYTEEVAAQQGEESFSDCVSSFGNRDNSEENNTAEKLDKQARKNLMKKMDKDLVREIRTIYEEKYGTLDSNHRQVPETSAASQPATSGEGAPEAASAVEPQDPTVYKILAYDPTMQEINTAETTSIVPDSASALTPAEVLLRLSNPAKFFPHFQPLQAEGYEIVSGSGDVLVFRKVRPAGRQGSKCESTSSIQDHKRKTTNPIDGMQSSPIAATGNFASPTGFVNHDLPVSDPPFKSNIDVRREEPVFSGKSNWQGDTESTRRKSKGRGKRLLIGAAWVAGCSYAIGVVAEFFRTGGMDGRGPKGF
jgi:hypothetical protein